MSDELITDLIQDNDNDLEEIKIITKIEETYKLYESCENSKNDSYGDYGKLKIAKLGLDFARYELVSLIKEADERGFGNCESIQRIKGLIDRS